VTPLDELECWNFGLRLEILPSHFTTKCIFFNCASLGTAATISPWYPLQTYQSFDGTLCRYPGEKIFHLAAHNETSCRARVYRIPQSHHSTFKDDLERPSSIGVLEHQGQAEWISGNFPIPTKDNDVEWIWDFGVPLTKQSSARFILSPEFQTCWLVGPDTLDDESKELLYVRSRRPLVGIVIAAFH
jgi:hypothetical protein